MKTRWFLDTVGYSGYRLLLAHFVEFPPRLPMHRMSGRKYLRQMSLPAAQTLNLFDLRDINDEECLYYYDRQWGPPHHFFQQSMTELDASSSWKFDHDGCLVDGGNSGPDLVHQEEKKDTSEPFYEWRKRQLQQLQVRLSNLKQAEADAISTIVDAKTAFLTKSSYFIFKPAIKIRILVQSWCLSSNHFRMQLRLCDSR
jgi:hypothetical protein